MANALAYRLTGLDLRIRRVVAGVTQVDVAEAMGVSRQRIGHIESLLRPTASTAIRYMRALDESSAALVPGDEEAA